jgi:hypothetical protein
MSARTQSALTKTAASGREANRAKRSPANEDVGELLLTELSERRARLTELLGLIRTEVARKMASEKPSRMTCRRTPGTRGNTVLRQASPN